ncbi:hypothetical protein BKA69DRAFT_1052600 [Paraphysoderma sedebokerense]|nr:hypothetical protein BKA69DRAFT_1052600 [Paraphysoderma sedebokerense]
MCDKSFISFHDFSPRATFLYVSPSVYDILGFKPEEMIGTSTYDYVWPPDWEVGSRLHREIIGFDKVAVLTIVRYG